MAEATDRPPDPKVLAGPLPAAPALARDETPQAYGSLSLLAVGGLSLAALYALVVAGGAVIALSNRTPWVLPPWSLAVPVAAGVLCWAARVQIQNSEGALTGARLAVWGLRLSLVVGLLYGAYYAACYLAVTQMATAVADEWFDNLKNDRLDKAFLMGQPPPRPADDANLRARLELEFDRGPGGSGALTNFRRSQFVRQMEQGGTACQTQCLGVKDWGNTAGGYQVELTYRVSTPYTSSEVLLTVVCADNGDDSGGRQWYVKVPQTASQPEITTEGERMVEQMHAAQPVAQAWVGKVIEWNWEQAYLDTLPAAERERQAKERGPRFAEGLQVFRAGGLVRAESPTFWAGEKDRDKIIATVKSFFGHGGENPDKMSLEMGPPKYQREGDRVRVGFDLTIPMPPQYIVQGLLVLAADAPAGQPSVGDWRIESLDLLSGKSISAAGGAPRPAPSGVRTPEKP